MSKISIDIGNSGLSSNLPFPFFNDINNLFIYDDFTKSILIYSQLDSTFSEMISFSNENRFEISDMQSFIVTDLGLFTFSPNHIIHVNKSGDINKILVEDLVNKESGEFLDYEYKIQFNFTFGNNISSFNDKNGVLYFLLKKNDNYKIAEYNIHSPRETRLIDVIDNGLIAEHKIGNQFTGKVSLSNAVTPILTYANDKLIISYPFENYLQVLDLNTNKIIKVTPNSTLYPNSKVKQVILKDQLAEFVSKIKDWNNDYSFGPAYWNEQNRVYYRVVKGESSHLNPFDGDLYITFFNESFDLINDEEISKSNRHTFEYFGSPEALFVKQISDSEDDLNYTKISM
ncbi:hypothetical protein PBT90_18105 [Algoriphagus halophytocola]|uniref:6-bladed beta-propeller n=1 Tax=Algoriphagus halophytocola TaxID=2991499 RepID=A0ABY6MGI3_9BACT|nr:MULTISPECIES: hypothetical protein [unclassified Algoriphagus]UZD21431.1 hypothetical protein OM944_12235 [Algoriphagus sp. TR-M5]WBL42643.1 hypothetical protein PBT90_18105 [Algoriphagus sp. TR-M9]